MSRIGNRIIQIPEGVTVEEKDGNITVTGPKGTLTMPSSDKIKLKVENNELKITRDDDRSIAMHGTINSLVNNMIIGVTKGYEKSLEIVGVGYRFNVQGNKIVIAAGYSHPYRYTDQPCHHDKPCGLWIRRPCSYIRFA